MEPLLVGCHVSKLKLRFHVPVNTSLNQKHSMFNQANPNCQEPVMISLF